MHVSRIFKVRAGVIIVSLTEQLIADGFLFLVGLY